MLICLTHILVLSDGISDFLFVGSDFPPYTTNFEPLSIKLNALVKSLKYVGIEKSYILI